MTWDYCDLDIDYNFDIPAGEYEVRVARVRNAMAERNLDFAFSYGTETFPGDILYLSGFDINIEVGGIVLLSQDRMFLLSGPEAGGAAQLDTRYGEPRMVWELAAPDLDYDRVPGVTTIKDCVREMFGKAGPGRVGFLTYPELMSKKCHDDIVAAVPAGAEIVEATDILYELRMNKSDNEQTLMRSSTAIAVEGMKAVLNNGKPGMMECAWGAHAAFKMRELGAHSLAFQPMIHSGKRALSVVGKSYNKIIEDGEVVSLAVGCRYKGYAGHLCRTAVAGAAPSEEQRFLLDMCSEAAQAACDNIVYDAPMADMDRAAHEVFVKHGYGQFNQQSNAHGVGIVECVGEGVATMKSSGRFPKNIVMATDVYLTNLDVAGLYGCRAENMMLIDGQGITHNLTGHLPFETYL